MGREGQGRLGYWVGMRVRVVEGERGECVAIARDPCFFYFMV